LRHIANISVPGTSLATTGNNLNCVWGGFGTLPKSGGYHSQRFSAVLLSKSSLDDLAESDPALFSTFCRYTSLLSLIPAVLALRGTANYSAFAYRHC